MRIDKAVREVTSSGVQEIAKATIKATPKIFDMFADQTYANKPVAIMRELVANGIDAHIAAGKALTPVEVTLPTSLDPTCIIKDFGIGMSHDFVMGPFMAYTDGSTKDGSNDQIGGFGIGSKSPFAYVDQFTLRVVHNGTLSVYTMFKDTDGIPAIGLQAQTTTTEPNGVEVSFPVEEEDIQTFRDAAQEALQYFLPLPTVHNGEIRAPKYTYVGKNWALREKSEPLGVIMGGVRYPVQPDSLSYDVKGDKQLSPLLQYGIDITLPIGSCAVAMSREALSYTPKTSESIKKALAGILDDVVQTFSTLFDTCSTEWEAMELLWKELGGGNSWNRSARQQLMAGNARYKGRELKTEFKLADVDLIGAKAWRIDPKRNRRGVNCPNPKWGGLTDLYGIVPGAVEAVIFDDMEQSPKNKNVAKIKHYVDEQCQQADTIVVIRHEKVTLKKLRELLRGCPEIVLTSTLPEPPKATTSAGTVRPKVRMFKYDGTKDGWTTRYHSNLNPGRYGKKGVEEIEYAKQPASGTCVVMQNFELPARLGERMDTGLFQWSDLVFVNYGDWDKIKDNFTNFEDAWTARIDKELAKRPDLAAQLAVANDGNINCWYRYIKTLLDHGVTLRPGKPFTKIAELYEQYVVPLTVDERKFAPFVTAALPKGVNTEKLAKDFKAKQRSLQIILGELQISDPEHLAIIKDYV